MVSSATYWRRRGVALAASLTVLTGLTWVVNGALGGGRTPSQAATRSGPAATSVQGHPHGKAARRSPGPHATHAAGHHPAAGAGSGYQRPLAGETVDLGSQPRPKPHPSVTSPGGNTAPAPGSGPHACATGALVLTLHSGRYRYGQGKLAGFVVDAVSTASQPCGLNLSGRFVSVVVASGGTPLWDSSSCVRGPLSRVVTMRRGVPAYLRVTWDRRTSLSGCSGQGSEVPGGIYTVAAFDGQLHSKSVTFALTGRGPAAPKSSHRPTGP
jgi:hypothetical protein